MTFCKFCGAPNWKKDHRCIGHLNTGKKAKKKTTQSNQQSPQQRTQPVTQQRNQQPTLTDAQFAIWLASQQQPVTSQPVEKKHHPKKPKKGNQKGNRQVNQQGNRQVNQQVTRSVPKTRKVVCSNEYCEEYNLPEDGKPGSFCPVTGCNHRRKVYTPKVTDCVIS